MKTRSQGWVREAQSSVHGRDSCTRYESLVGWLVGWLCGMYEQILQGAQFGCCFPLHFVEIT